MKKNVDDMHRSTVHMDKTTTDMNTTTKEMSETTSQMNDRTKSMAETTEAMKTITEKMNETTQKVAEISAMLGLQTDEMYNSLRQGDTLNARRQELESLLKARETPAKLSHAAKYFMAFEFQFWTGHGQDNEDELEELYASAAREFLREAQELIPNNEYIVKPYAQNKGDLDSDNNRYQSINALAATLHMQNLKQELMIKKNLRLEMTMYKMIEISLRASKEIEKGTKSVSDFPLFVKEVLVYEEVARYLIKARYQFLGVMALAKISNIQDGMIEIAKMFIFNWRMKLSKLNSVQIEEIAKWYNSACNSREILRFLGESTALDSKTKQFYKHLRITEFGTGTQKKSDIEADFIKKLDRYRFELP